MRKAILSCAMVLAACGGERSPSTPAGSRPSASEYWALEDTGEGLTDVSPDLLEVLQPAEIEGACDRYRAGQTDRRTMLLCGKWMFFYDDMNTPGAPTGLLRFLSDNFPDQIGPGFTKLGMIEDPTSPEHLPLGLAPGLPLEGGIETLTFTCASCHFGQLPDGRYAVGAPNHRYDYGMQILATAVLPTALLAPTPDAIDEVAAARLKPLVDEIRSEPALMQQLLVIADGFIQAGLDPVVMPKADQRAYASWLPGTQDFLMTPVPIDDGVHTVSKISALWGVPTPEEIRSTGMPHAMLGWTGSTQSLMSFFQGFTVLGTGEPSAAMDERVRPLEQYLYTLRTPRKPALAPEAVLVEGRRLFEEKGCLDCHDGPRGSGRRLFTYDEIGTDKAMEQWGDDRLTSAAAPKPNKLKSPRITGTWAMSRFLHNGSVPTLGALFCLDGPRGSLTEEPYGDAGHDYTCEGLSADEKRSLIAFLEAN